VTMQFERASRVVDTHDLYALVMSTNLLAMDSKVSLAVAFTLSGWLEGRLKYEHRECEFRLTIASRVS
jgi:hypothetical protein